MATIYPSKENRIYDDVDINGNSAEEIVCNYIENAIKDDKFIGCFHPRIGTRTGDLLLLVPNRGVLIIEIKQYSKEFLEGINNQGILVIKEQYRIGDYKNNVNHPHKQAIEYRNALRNKLKASFARQGIEWPICKIGCMIAMPNLTVGEYEELALNYELETTFAITKEWLSNYENFYGKFKKAISKIFGEIKTRVDFDDDYYNLVLSEFLPEYKNKKEFIKDKEEKYPVEQEIEVVNEFDREAIQLFSDSKKLKRNGNYDYSITKLFFEDDDTNQIIETHLDLRKKGTKIFLIGINISDLKKVEIIEKLSSEIQEINPKPIRESIITFLFELHFLKVDSEKINLDSILQKNANTSIKDGKIISKINLALIEKKCISKEEECLYKLLNLVDEKTLFNLKQYIIEHFPIGKDVAVSASAGTGKTYTMVGRIAYLVHKELIQTNSDRSIDDLVYMMTFTNNSTDEMKERLRKHYISYFNLTKNSIYMDLLEGIGNMKIKTIDAMSKYVLGKFSHLLGISSDFSIKTGKYELDTIINKKIDTYIREDNNTKDILKKFDNKDLYEIKKYIDSFINFLANRKIPFDTSNECNSILANEYTGETLIKTFIEKIIKESNTEFLNLCMEGNYIPLSYTGIQLQRIRRILLDEKTNSLESRYLFIDEFQDTDDKQIELIDFFAEYWRMNLFVVGDKKQCIYGFRGAKETAFEKIKSINNNRHYNLLHLKKNYRTNKSLIDDINKIFTGMPDELFLYDTSDNLVAQKGLDCGEEKCFYGEEYSEDKLISIIENRIDELNNSNEQGVIAILVRKNSDVDKIKELNKKTDKFTIEFDNTGKFFKMDAVIDFYQLVDFLSDSNNTAKKYNIAKSPYALREVSNAEFLGKNNKMTISELDEMLGFKDREKFEVYLSTKENEVTVRTSPILKALRMFIKNNKPWERYIPENLQKSDYLERDLEAINEVREAYRRHIFQLFHIFIEDNKTEYITLNKIKQSISININTDQKIDAVENKNEKKGIRVVCMTIHKSKGLQYDTVIMPFTTTDITKEVTKTSLIENIKENHTLIEYSLNTELYNGNLITKSNEYERMKKKVEKNLHSEELRILYVSITRAEKKFIYLYEGEKLERLKGEKKKYLAQYLL